MNITPVDNVNGILLIKEGKVLKQLDSFNLVCSYNISYLHVTTLSLASLYENTKSLNTNIVSEQLHKSYADQIEHKLSIIHNKLIFLAPHSRVKRGLINGLGSVVKSITGNLDYDDAVRMEQQIKNINNKIHNVQEKSIIIAQKTIEEFGNQLNKINENQNKLVSMLKNITMHSNVIYRQFNLLEVHIQIDFSLQIILDKLMLLEDAMAFSQIGIMHPSILNTQNLVTEMLEMERKLTFLSVAPISLENIHIIEKSIDVKAYSTEHSLNFILEIPSVGQPPYDLIHLYSIPNKQNLTIIPKSKYLVLGSGEYAYVEEDCRHITEDLRLCKQLDVKPLQDAGDCVTALVRHQVDHSTCSYAKMNLQNGKLQNITPNSWLLIANSKEVLKATCGNDITYHTLTTPQLISISNDCQVRVMNRTLQTHSNTVTVHDVIPLPQQPLIPTEETRFELQLEDISLDNIHTLISKAQNIQDEETFEDWTPIATTPSWSTIVLYIIGFGILCWKSYQWFTKRKTTDTSSDKSGGPEGTSRMRFYLKEGRVTTA